MLIFASGNLCATCSHELLRASRYLHSLEACHLQYVGMLAAGDDAISHPVGEEWEQHALQMHLAKRSAVKTVVPTGHVTDCMTYFTGQSFRQTTEDDSVDTFKSLGLEGRLCERELGELRNIEGTSRMHVRQSVSLGDVRLSSSHSKFLSSHNVHKGIDRTCTGS